MKKILITGASGFIGSFLVEEALIRGYRVYAAIRKSSNKMYLTDARINFFTINLDNKKQLVDDFIKFRQEGILFDYVIHNAGVTKVIKKSDFETVNFQYTKNLVEALIEAECIPEKFIYLSSLGAYGPGNEITWDPIKESDMPCPQSLYGKSKYNAEQFIKEQNLLTYIIIRPTGVYGPRDTDYFSFIKTINLSIEPYIGSLNKLLSFVYVKDLTRIIFIALQSRVINKSYFVTDGKTYTSKEFAQIVKKALSKKTIKFIVPKVFVRIISLGAEKLSLLFNEPSVLNADKYITLTAGNWSCDSSQAEQDFSFKAEYDLVSGITETIKWYKKNKWI